MNTTITLTIDDLGAVTQEAVNREREAIIAIINDAMEHYDNEVWNTTAKAILTTITKRQLNGDISAN